MYLKKVVELLVDSSIARIAVTVFSIFDITRSASAVVIGSVASNWSSGFRKKKLATLVQR